MSRHAKPSNRTKYVSIGAAFAALSLIVANSVQAANFDVNGQALEFTQGKVNGTGSLIDQGANPGDSLGNNVGVGDFVDFYDVITIGGQQIDARMTVMGLQDMQGGTGTADQLEYIDEDSSTNEAIKIRTDYQVGQGESYADLKLEFFTDLAGTPASATLQNVLMTTTDLDGYQFVELNGFDTYKLSTNTTLGVSETRPGFTRFIDTVDASYSGTDSDTKGRTTVTFNSVSTVNFRVGQSLPDGQTETGSSLFYLDFSVGDSWSGLEGEALVAPSAVAPTYLGPIPKLIDTCVPTTGGDATLSGERLNGISSVSVDEKVATIVSKSNQYLTMTFPALAEGTYDVEYTSSAGKLTHLSSLKVCEQKVEPKQRFFVYERFANYRGDRGAVVTSDRQAIEEFIDSNPGLTRVTCVGSTSGVPALSTDPALAKARAANACSVVEELVPGVTTREAFVTGRGIGQFHRAVILYGVGHR